MFPQYTGYTDRRVCMHQQFLVLPSEFIKATSATQEEKEKNKKHQDLVLLPTTITPKGFKHLFNKNVTGNPQWVDKRMSGETQERL